MFETLTIEENEALYDMLKSARRHCRGLAQFGHRLFTYEGSGIGRKTHDLYYTVKLDLDELSADLTDAYGKALDALR